MPGKKSSDQLTREAHGKRAMGELLQGFSDPSIYDSLPLAEKHVIAALKADIAVHTLPPFERVEGRPHAKVRPDYGGVALLEALALCLVDGIRGQLSQPKPDLRLTAGLFIEWFTEIKPALEGMPFLTLREAVELGTVLANLRGIIEAAMASPEIESKPSWEPAKYQQIAAYFSDLKSPKKKAISRDPGKRRTAKEKGESVDRSAGNYRDRARLYLFGRIEQVAIRLDRKIEELLPERVDDATRKPRSRATARGGVKGWARWLAKCVADYGSYELQQIKAQLAQQGLADSFGEWFLPRQGCYSTLTASEELAPPVELTSLCQPGLWTAVMDYRCSGTTTAFLWLSEQYCRGAKKAAEPVVLRLDARAYLPRAKVGESPYQFLAQQVYGSGHNALAQRQEFENVLREAKVVCLVDNLARLSAEDQVRIGQWFQLFSGAVFTTPPGISDDDLQSICGKDAMRVALTPLGKSQIEEFIPRFASKCDRDFDQVLARHIALRELPNVAQWPFGLTIICEQVLAHQSDCASIVAHYIAELLGRDGMPVPQWRQNLTVHYPALEALLRIAALVYGRYLRASDAGDLSLDFTREQALVYLGDWENAPLAEAVALPLVIKAESNRYRFLNREILGFLAALHNVKEISGQCGPRTLPSIFAQDSIVRATNRHYFALLGNGRGTARMGSVF